MNNDAICLYSEISDKLILSFSRFESNFCMIKEYLSSEETIN